MAVTPKQAKKLLEKNIQNVKKALDNGKVLTTVQLSTLQALAAKPDGAETPTKAHAKDQVELAIILGVNRKTVKRWLKKEGNPGAESNGKYNIFLWLQWVKAHGLKTTDDAAPEKNAVQVQQLLLQNEKLKFQIGVFKKQYVPTDDVEKWGADLGMEIRKAVVSIHKVAPSLAGLSVAEIEIRLRELEDETLTKLHLLAQRVEGMKKVTKEAAYEE
jgi:hypothetical protein